MTEDEAKTKWCPYARVVGADGGKVLFNQPAFNRVQANGEPTGTPLASVCIGSACMAWRWTDHQREDGDLLGGYCGLAGRP